MSGPPDARALVMAKAPVPGYAKTRLAARVGDAAAAGLAAAALLDTLRAATAAFGAFRCHLALAGDLDQAEGAAPIRAALAGWSVRAQRGHDLGDRLACAHLDLAARAPGPVVQLGMDTPQVTPALLRRVTSALTDADAVLGPADDGGWWVLVLRDPADAAALVGVPMSSPVTGEATREALVRRGLRVVSAPALRDVDTADDAAAVAEAAPSSEFAAAWRRVSAEGRAMR